MVRFRQAVAGLLLFSGLVTATEPCAQVAEAQQKQLMEHPNTTTFTVTAELAHACLTSVPFTKDDALRLLDGLPYFWDWQSTKPFLKDPPKGYAVPGTDLDGGLASIRQKAASDGYKSEFDFQFELDALTRTVHDGHFNLAMDLLYLFSFVRGDIGPIVSISKDGKEFPEVYAVKDIMAGLANTSAITKIDGQSANDWLKKYSFNGRSQDPDALFNGLLYGLPRTEESRAGSFYSYAGLYTGNDITVEYENGHKMGFTNYARFTANFTGVKDGRSFYNKFCGGRSSRSSLVEIPETRHKDHPFFTSSPISQPPSYALTARSLPPYITPVQRSVNGDVAGYFLEGSDSHIAVLYLSTFAGGANSTDTIWDYSYTITRFLEDCRKTNKKKLIIDVSGNPGGVIFLGYDAFKQLLPNGKVETPFNQGAIEQFDLIGKQVNYLLTHPKAPKAPDAEQERNDIFDLNAYVDPNGKKYKTWRSYFGPERVRQGNFIHLGLWDFNNSEMSLKAGGLIVSGYGNRTQIAPQAFKLEDMVIVTDGVCASTCSIFSDLMRRNGMKFISAAGLPQAGHMQAVGGVKGTQVLSFRELWTEAQLLLKKYSTPFEERRLEKTALGKMVTKGAYVLQRLTNKGSGGRINYRNAVYTDDKARIPRQFVYEAAECKIFMTMDALVDVKAWWGRIAHSWWGNKDICVDGSMA
ncbi:hypothetical protein MferCBS31731_007105 [Microsporum ferrugineum]